MSDTLMYRSPTCTAVDRQAATELSQIAGIAVEELAESMFRAGSDLSQKTEEEIFYQDYKRFTAQDLSLGVGQVSSMSKEELQKLKGRLLPYMERSLKASGSSILLFMLTNIADESTDLLFVGAGASEIVEEAFGVKPEPHSVRLPGVVSRKKQMIPSILRGIQKINE